MLSHFTLLIEIDTQRVEAESRRGGKGDELQAARETASVVTRHLGDAVMVFWIRKRFRPGASDVTPGCSFSFFSGSFQKLDTK